MPLRLRIASMTVASATAIGLSVVIGVAPPANAEPCTDAAAQAQPDVPAGPAFPSTGGMPTGHRPAYASAHSALPKLGAISREIISAFTPQSETVQKQAAVAPQPTPPGAKLQPPTAAQPEAAPAPPPAPLPADPPGTSLVGWVTGPNSPNNTLQRFAVSGTDLGLMWDNGSHQVLMAFGDTSGYCSAPGHQWRYNVLMRSNDGALANTINVSNSPMWARGISKQVINSTRWASSETGIIPTAGVSVGGNQYMNFMSIRSWDANGAWTTNYSAIAVSPDNGEHWGVYPGSVRARADDGVPGARYLPGNENFQQGAFLKPGPGDPYIYSFGTPNGRGGSAYVARVLPSYVPDLTKYQYWNSDSNAWVPTNPGAATPVIPGPVGEMSAQYNTYLHQYLAMYCNGGNDVVFRTAPAPQGPWGPEQMIVPSMQFPGGIYAPFLHPWSTGRELYFNLSEWNDYNVMLMKTVLA
jgi:D-arabinan endo alpha-(1,5)-arabinofuranosidase